MHVSSTWGTRPPRAWGVGCPLCCCVFAPTRSSPLTPSQRRIAFSLRSEHSGYWESTSFLDEVDRKGETSFFDSVSGDLLFVAPRNRSVADFLAESRSHGWPSFRDEEVNWSFVRVLDDGECVSVSGTHLGHNLPDKKGNRYCINLVSVCANPR